MSGAAVKGYLREPVYFDYLAFGDEGKPISGNESDIIFDRELGVVFYV